MKSIFLLIGFSLISAPALFGQSNSKSIQFGVSVTPQISSIWNRVPYSNGKGSFGYAAEAFLSMRLSQRIELESGIQYQDADIKQRNNDLQWPADVVNGQWAPGRSYEQLEVKYSAIGFRAGIDFALDTKENGWSLNCYSLFRKLLKVKDELLINESGFLHDPINDGYMNTYHRYQFFLGFGIAHSFKIGSDSRLNLGPSIEYSIRDLISESVPHPLWTYHGGHPVFFGIRTEVLF